MMSHRLDIPEATFQRAGGSKRCRSRDAACEFHRLDRAAHRVGPRAGGPPSAPASGSHPPGISATLRSRCREATSGLNARSLRPSPTGLGPTRVPSADRSMPPESWSGRASVTSSRALRATPSIGVGMPVAGSAHDRESIKRAPIVRSWLEFRHHRKGPGLGHVDVGHGDVVAARAPHPHDVPRIDDFALFAGKVDHPHLGLVRRSARRPRGPSTRSSRRHSSC